MNEAGEEHASASPPSHPAEQPDVATTNELPEKDGGKFVVVGIGASAGGLEALDELMRHVPIDSMAFIIVQHLAPHHDSVLSELLARSSKIRISKATDGMVLEANHAYVIPPNADLAVMHGVIHVITPSNPSAARLPIDYLFRSIADDQGPSAIGIVLSGTGTDGTFGLKAIKAAGGITFAQEPTSAKYDGMPRSALAGGCADFCLSPREIGAELTRIAKRPFPRRVPRVPAPSSQVQDQLGKLFVFIRSEFGNDLTQYKLATIERRVERRMTLHKVERLEEYVRYVQSNREELHALYQDMLISVTSFFRDPEVFEALKSRIFPQLIAARQSTATIRVWVPACSTGEEVYSIAISLVEFCEEKSRDTRIQIFGTDIDDESILHARRGVYPANIAADVSVKRLNRFFVGAEGMYQISRRIRDSVVFSKHNLLKDAPFSRIDLTSCRNLLIYLQPPSQKNVLRILHYALQPNGYLVLGSSESVGDAPDLFSLVDAKSKLYSKKYVASQVGLDVNFGVPVSQGAPEHASTARPSMNLQGLADRKVLELYGPPGVVINEELDILQFRGHTGPYLDPVPGAATFNILRVARFELHMALKSAIQAALSQGRRVTSDVSYRDEGKPSAVKLDVVPLQDPETKTRCLLVSFQKASPPQEPVSVSPSEENQGDAWLPLRERTQELENELAATKDYLQALIADRDGTTEELKAANEELQSSNEELQSTNEELETSKEEMQSTNEELTTLNQELQTRMTELSQTNDDLYNVLSGVDNAVVIVGMDLRIRRYTAAAEKLFNLVPGDIGRSVGFLDAFLGAGPLEAKVGSTIQNLATQEEELLAQNHRWYSLKIRPYKTLDHAIRGALVGLTDVDVRKRATEMTRDVSAYAARFLTAIGHPLLIVDRKLRIVWANESFLSVFQLSAEETVGTMLAELSGRGRQWADPGLRERLHGVFDSSAVFRDFELRHRLHGAGEVVMKVGAGQIPASTEMPLVLVSIEPLHPFPSQMP